MCQSSQWIVLTEEVKSPVKSSWLILFHKRAVEIWLEKRFILQLKLCTLWLPHLHALNFVIVFKPNFILQWVFTPLSQKPQFFLGVCSLENTIKSSSKTFLHILPPKCTYAKHILEQLQKSFLDSSENTAQVNHPYFVKSVPPALHSPSYRFLPPFSIIVVHPPPEFSPARMFFKSIKKNIEKKQT